ncbi:hypothetical protein FSP39_005702, partial [Pinctada imbricata]
AEIKTAFDSIDRNKSGTIDASELAVVMRWCGMNPTETEIQSVIDEVDSNGNGTLEFAEFISLVAGIYKSPEKYQEEIRVAFRKFDKDGTGKINPEELREVLTQQGDNLNEEEIQEFLKDADKNGDGYIDYEGELRNVDHF